MIGGITCGDQPSCNWKGEKAVEAFTEFIMSTTM